ncbi:hypothetical protein [Belnapia moabensis]|uniref:hypothetical protein n=1 Tax=Belnapia moabensis TaxID=365533 RepID=UPI0005B7700F|nr:hypothetical protein [Belnapia moabensis]
MPTFASAVAERLLAHDTTGLDPAASLTYIVFILGRDNSLGVYRTRAPNPDIAGDVALYKAAYEADLEPEDFRPLYIIESAGDLKVLKANPEVWQA